MAADGHDKAVSRKLLMASVALRRFPWHYRLHRPPCLHSRPDRGVCWRCPGSYSSRIELVQTLLKCTLRLRPAADLSLSINMLNTERSCTGEPRYCHNHCSVGALHHQHTMFTGHKAAHVLGYMTVDSIRHSVWFVNGHSTAVSGSLLYQAGPLSCVMKSHVHHSAIIQTSRIRLHSHIHSLHVRLQLLFCL